MVIPDKKPMIVPMEQPTIEYSKAFIEAKEKAIECLQPALTANAAIPLDSFCPVPEMKVFLPVPKNTVILSFSDVNVNVHSHTANCNSLTKL